MFSKAILTLASSVAMVLVAGSGQTLADPAAEFMLAGSHYFQIKPVVPRPPMVQPQVRVPIDRDRLRRESSQDQAPTVTAPPGFKPDTAKAPNRTSAPKFVALPKPRLDPAGEGTAGDAAERLSRLAELAEINALREHIEALQAMLNIAGLAGSPNASGIGDWGAGPNEDGNQNPIPGRNDGEGPGNLVDDAAGRMGAGGGPDHGDGGLGMLGRVTRGLGSGKNVGPNLSPGSPSDALGGIASTKTSPEGNPRDVVEETPRQTTHDPQAGTVTSTYSKVLRDGTTVIVDETSFLPTAENPTPHVVRERVVTEMNPVLGTITTSTHQQHWSGSDSYSREVTWGTPAPPNPPRGRGIDRTQDPNSDSGGGVIAWIPPNCGSAECNAIRDYLKNPQGTLGQVMDKGNRVLGDRGADPGAGAGHRLTVDQHGLVVLYGPESGPPAGGGGRVQRFDPSKFRSD